MQPGELPEKHFIACFDRETDDYGNELPVIRLQAGDIFWDREPGEDDETFLDRVLIDYCQGMPLGTVPMLIAHRQAPSAKIEKNN